MANTLARRANLTLPRFLPLIWASFVATACIGAASDKLLLARKWGRFEQSFKSSALYVLPASPVITWLNPRTGETNSAAAVIGARACQFPTPDPGDWLLVVKAGK